MSDQEETKVSETSETLKVEPSETNGAGDSATVKPEDVKTETDKTDDKTEDVKADDAKTGNVEPEEKKDSAYSLSNPPPDMLKVKRPAFNERKEDSNKFDPSTREDSSDPKEIRTQVEFYFSDSNLSTDKFLGDLTGRTENKAVPLSTICSFKRMRRFKPYSSVVAALKDSQFLIVEGDEDRETIRRKTAWEPVKASKIDERSVYVKGFGEESGSMQFDLEAFFAQYGQFNSVRLRRGDNKGFKGSVFVEWVDKDQAEKFMALDPKPTWKDHPLLILWKTDYLKDKNEAIASGAIKPSQTRNASYRGRGHRRGRDGESRSQDKDNWKERRDRDQKNGHRDQRGKGRGRGSRGSRGRGRDHGGSRRDQEEDKSETKTEGDGRPVIHTSAEHPSDKAVKTDTDASTTTNGKRAREDEDHEAPPAKKVDTKEPETTAA